MIVDLGLGEMNMLLNHRDKLNKVIYEAYEVISKYLTTFYFY